MPVILGISPGNRHSGIAIMKDGKLIDWRILSFPGIWSTKKLRAICMDVYRVIKDYEVDAVVVKIPDELPRTKAFIQLVGALNILFERRKLKAIYATLSELKDLYKLHPRCRQELFVTHVVARHPELLPEYQREQMNVNKYYEKLFEAVAAAHYFSRVCE